MNVNDLTAGIEIELNLPAAVIRDRGIQIGGRHHGIQVPGLPRGWKAEHDGSAETRSYEFVAVEIVSPVLQGIDGFRQIKTVVETLKAWGAEVNASCGFHVHVGFGARTIAELRRLVHLVANHEQGIYATTGTKNRENGSWCKSVKQDFRSVTFAGEIANLAHPARDRYHLLNVSNLINGGKPTVEFRAFAGTLNVSKMCAYVRLCLGLVEKALSTTRVAPWDAKPTAATSPIHRSGEGQTELTRLFYSLGWIRGREEHTFGMIGGEDLPDLESSKRVLMKMARKYDGVALRGDEPEL